MKLRSLRKSWFLILACGWLWQLEATAQEHKWTHFGLRPLGMGNAYVAVADDYNALFYNPAGLARLDSWDGELFNPHVAISQNTTTFINDAVKLGSGDAASGVKGVLQLFEKQAGKNQYLTFGLTPHLVFPGFGFGIALELESSMVFHRYPSAFLDIGPRVTIPISFAMNFLEDRLSVGAGIKFVARGGLAHEFSMEDISALSSGDGEESSGPKVEDYIEGGTGFGADVGLLFTPIKTMEPTLGLSITDFGGIQYEKQDINGTSLGAPATRLPSLNVGVSAKPYKTERTYLLTSVDIHSANQPIHFSKKLNLGSEFGIGKQLLKFQLGLHQGYLTGGFQFDVGLLNIRFTTYAEELGPVAGSIADRRYAMQFKLIF